MEECAICMKEIRDDQEAENWSWAEEPAHMECVLKEAHTICDKCGFLSIHNIIEEEVCEDGCGKTMRSLTNKDKEKFRKEAKENN